MSFMSGNSTRLAVGLAGDTLAAAVAGALVAGFVCGVVLGSLVRAAVPSRGASLVLLLVAFLLAFAALIDAVLGRHAPAFAMAAAMGAENAVFQRHGEVSIGVTYMTGTLVKFGQQLAAAFAGGSRWNWLPYLILWCSLVGGAVAGAFANMLQPSAALWLAATAAIVLAAFARSGPTTDDSASSESG